MASAAKRRSKGSKASDGKRKRKLSGSDEDGPAFLSSKYAEPPTSKIYNSRFNHTQPAELFRKDLISAMKLPDGEQLGSDDYWLIEDSWKPEWERGVQVPVYPEQLPEPNVRIIKKKKKKEGNLKKLPKKLIRFTRDSFFNPEYHVMSYMNTLAERTCRYDMDDTDCQWLKSVNEDREDFGLQPLEETFVEQVIEEFEVQAYVNFQEAIKSEEGLGVEYDEDAICDVCRSPDSQDCNEMVFCDSCNICVHQICYGITKIPEGSWICRTCALGIRPPCVLCPNRGGAMKTTRCGQNWAHVGCAVWIPEVSFLNFMKMEPIVKISQIPASRWALVCSLCKEKTGACISCSEKGCKAAFHVTCAFNEGVQMRASVKNTSNDDDTLKAFCHKHSKKKFPLFSDSEDEMMAASNNSKDALTSEERANLRKQKIQEKEAEFYNYVSVEEVAEMFQYDKADIETVFYYWKLKRKANWNRAFLTPKIDTENSCVEENSPMAFMKKMVHHRQDLERARNLCYMVIKRERLLKSWTEMKEKIFLKQVEVLSKEGKRLSPDEKEAVLNANMGDIAYDKKFSGPSPNTVSVLTNLVGEDIVKTQINGLVKTPTKKVDRMKTERTPNPYAKHYLNGLMKRSLRWFPVTGKQKKSQNNVLLQNDKSNQNFASQSNFSDDVPSSNGLQLSDHKTDLHFESDSCVSQSENNAEVFNPNCENLDSNNESEVYNPNCENLDSNNESEVYNPNCQNLDSNNESVYNPNCQNLESNKESVYNPNCQNMDSNNESEVYNINCENLDSNNESAHLSDTKENICSPLLEEWKTDVEASLHSNHISSELDNNLDLYVYPLVELQNDNTSLPSNVENVLTVEPTSTECVTIEVKSETDHSRRNNEYQLNSESKKQKDGNLSLRKKSHSSRLQSKSKFMSDEIDTHSKNSSNEKSNASLSSNMGSSDTVKSESDSKVNSSLDIANRAKNSKSVKRVSNVFKDEPENEDSNGTIKNVTNTKSNLGITKLSKHTKNNLKSCGTVALKHKSNYSDEKISNINLASKDIDVKSILGNTCLKVSLERNLELQMEQNNVKLPLPYVVLKSEDILNCKNSFHKNNAIKSDDKIVKKDYDNSNVIEKSDKSFVSSFDSSCENKSDAKFRPVSAKNSPLRTQSPTPHVKSTENGMAKSKSSSKNNQDAAVSSSKAKVKILNISASSSNLPVNKHPSSPSTKCQDKTILSNSEDNASESNLPPVTKEKTVREPPVMHKDMLRGYKIPKKPRLGKSEGNSLDLKRGSSPLSPLPDITPSSLSGYQNKISKGTWKQIEPKKAISCKSRTNINGGSQQQSERLVLKLKKDTSDPESQRWQADPSTFNRGIIPSWPVEFVPGHIPPLLPPQVPPFIQGGHWARMREQGGFAQLHMNYARPGHYT